MPAIHTAPLPGRRPPSPSPPRGAGARGVGAAQLGPLGFLCHSGVRFTSVIPHIFGGLCLKVVSQGMSPQGGFSQTLARLGVSLCRLVFDMGCGGCGVTD